jgi:DNA-binding MarR family transcriptional regulator
MYFNTIFILMLCRTDDIIKNAVSQYAIDTRSLTDHELWSLVDRVRFAISRSRDLELAQFGLTIEQSSILYILSNRGGPTTTRDLEDITMRQHHSITSLINRMIRTGLVCREKSEAGRGSVIVMTPDGQILAKKATRHSLEMVFSVLTPRQKHQFAQLLSRLLDKSRDLLGISYKPPFLQNLININALDLKRKKRSKELSPDHELWSLVDRAGFAISRLRELELAQFGLTIEQSSILYILRHRDGLTTTKELEDITMRQQCSISTLLTRMTGMGLISRDKSGKGKRYSLKMTKEGQLLARKATIASLQMVFSTLQDNEKQQLAVLLTTLLDRARDLLGISYKPPFLQDIIKRRSPVLARRS